MSLNFNLLDEQDKKDCIYCMVQDKGLQFALHKRNRRSFLEWCGRSDEYKERIRKLVEQL